MKAHIFRELVNDLRDIATQWHGSQQLRERISRRLRQDVSINEDPANDSPVTNHARGAASFRLKPQLVIGDRPVPMPECEAPAKGTTYFTPDPHSVDHYGSYIWRNLQSNQRFLDRGLIHLDKEAAIAHGEALVALSKKKD